MKTITPVPSVPKKRTRQASKFVPCCRPGEKATRFVLDAIPEHRGSYRRRKVFWGRTHAGLVL